MCRAAGVLAGVPALCPGGGPALEDLRAPAAVRPVRGEPCAAACVHAGLAAGCGRDHNALLLEAIAALASLLGAPGPHPGPAAPPHVATGTCQNMNTECCRLMCSVRDVQFGGDFWRGQVGRQVAQHAQFASAQWLNRRPGPGAGTIDASDVVLAAKDVANDDDTACCLVNAPCCDRIPACTVPGVQLEAVRSGGLVMAEVAACEFTAPGPPGPPLCKSPVGCQMAYSGPPMRRHGPLVSFR